MADADDDWSDLEAQDEDRERQDVSQRASSTPGAAAGGARLSGKRRGPRSDGDFESQQSILKWVRQVPGPLQDVMKKQADQLDGDSSGRHLSEFASGNSDRYSIAVSTVFDDGAWVDMCSFLGMETTPGKTYGGVKMSRLKYPVIQILEGDKVPPKIPQLLLLVKTARYVDEEIVAVFHDPTGEIDGYFHREIVEQIGPALVEGTAILLRNVAVFEPVSTRGECYLNIIPRNLQRVILPNSHAVSSYEAAVQQFNATREQEVEQGAAEERESAPESPQNTDVFHHDTVRHTSTELSYLSQRQVVHRNPPVNSTVASIMSGKNTNAADEEEEPEATGLGRWQWSKLVPHSATRVAAPSGSGKDAQGEDEDGDEFEASSMPAPTSRFARLLASKRLRSSGSAVSPIDDATINSSGGEEQETGGDGGGMLSRPRRKKRTPTNVTFAPDVTSGSLDDRSLPSAVTEAPRAAIPHPSPSKDAVDSLAHSSLAIVEDVEEKEEDEEDEDDDW